MDSERIFQGLRMSHLIADLFARGSGNEWFLPVYLGGAISVGYAAYYWRFFAQWVGGIQGRDWPTAAAVIDVISVVEQTMEGDTGRHIVGYLATLTYFYRNPDLQVGEFSQSFSSEREAQAWCESYIGRHVMVHISQRDPSRSVLRKEDLDRTWR